MQKIAWDSMWENLGANRSSVRAQGVDDLQASEVSFVFGDNHAIIGFRDGGEDPCRGDSGPSLFLGGRSLGHQRRSDQARLFVEGEHPASE